MFLTRAAFLASKSITGTLAAAAVVMNASPGHAQNASWINSLGGFYENANNWVPGVVPTATNDVIFGVSGDYFVGLFNDQTVHDVLIANNVDLNLSVAGPSGNSRLYTLTGQATIDNSSLTLGGTGPDGRVNMEVGGKLEMQGGRFDLLNGAQLTSQTSLTNSNILEGAGSIDSTMIIRGTDATGQPSRWQSGGGTKVGDSGGPAGLAVLEGGQVSAVGSVSIGGNVMADGSSLEVRGTSTGGAPSSLTSGFFQLGFLSGGGGLSRATAQVADGANVITGGVQVFRDSRVIVDHEDVNRNASRLAASGFQVFGGFVDVLRGGLITSDSLSLDRLAIARVEGVGANGRPSRWDVNGNIRLGSSNGFGSLLIDSGLVTSTTTTIGEGTGSSLLSVEGLFGAQGVWENTGDVYVGGSTTGPEADGLLRLFDDDARVAIGGTLKVWSSGTTTMHGGILRADTIDHTHGGTFDFNAGTLGVNTFNGDLLNQAGTFAPGVGTDVGASTVVGDYTQQSSGKLALDIGGTGPGSTHDLVSITGDAQVDGLLELSLINGFTPDAADTFTVFAAGSLIGFFDNVFTGQRLDTTDGGGSFVVNYGLGSAFNENRIILSDFLANVLLAGDYNGSGQVEQGDLDLVLQNWGVDTDVAGTPAGWNHDLPSGLIEQTELDGVLQNWGSASTPDFRGSAVPEPSSMVVLVVGFSALINRRRRVGGHVVLLRYHSV